MNSFGILMSLILFIFLFCKLYKNNKYLYIILLTIINILNITYSILYLSTINL